MSYRRIPHALLTALGAVSALAVAGAALSQPDSTIQLVALDADPAGNTATSLGHLDPCVRVQPGSEVAVDLVVDAVPQDRPLIGFEIDLRYEPGILEVIAADDTFLLGSNGEYQPFRLLQDALPDSDGTFRLAVVDLASNEVSAGDNTEAGAGVLARITFKSLAEGNSAIAPIFDPPDFYPTALDLNNEVIEVRTIAGIRVAVGAACPTDQTEIEPTPLPPLSEAFNTPTPTAFNTPTPTPTPAAPATPVPTPTATPAVLPAAFPATGGHASGDSSATVGVIAAMVLALAAAAAWPAPRPRA